MTLPIITLSFLFANLLIYANKHGKTESKTYNFWHYLIGSVINIAVLYYFGFFDVLINKFK